MKLSGMSAVLAAFAAAFALCGCAGEGGSLLKVDLGMWNCKMGGSVTGTDSSGIGGTVKLENDSNFNLGLNEKVPEMELDLGTFVRMRLGMWNGEWSGRNDNCSSFAFLGINFFNESITTDLTVTQYNWGMEFCLLPLVDVVPDVNIRGYAGFGLKHLQMGLDVTSGASGNISETLPAPMPLVTIGAEADIAKYFTAFFRLDMCKLAFNYSDFDIDLRSTDFKAGVGAFYRFMPDSKGLVSPSLGLECGMMSDRLKMDIIKGAGSSSEQDFDFRMRFSGMFFQAVFSF